MSGMSCMSGRLIWSLVLHVQSLVLIQVLQSGETLPTPTQRCHSLRLDSDGALRVRLAPRDDHVASDCSVVVVVVTPCGCDTG